MRIICGKYKGKTFFPPKNLPVRPTTDFAKEGLFNMLANKIDLEECTILDLFCGTGNITFEFLSRGAKQITSVDAHSNCVRFIQDTIKTFNETNVITIKSDVFKFINHCSQVYDVIFVDPPYDLKELDTLPDLLFQKNMLAPDGLLIIEHGIKTKFENTPHFKDTRNYGNVNFSFFSY